MIDVTIPNPDDWNVKDYLFYIRSAYNKIPGITNSYSIDYKNDCVTMYTIFKMADKAGIGRGVIKSIIDKHISESPSNLNPVTFIRSLFYRYLRDRNKLRELNS